MKACAVGWNSFAYVELVVVARLLDFGPAAWTGLAGSDVWVAGVGVWTAEEAEQAEADVRCTAEEARRIAVAGQVLGPERVQTAGTTVVVR